LHGEGNYKGAFDAMAEPNRPLSPHILIYKEEITMVMSIVHRITGVGLYTGTAFLVWWLAAAAIGDGAFAVAQGFFGHWFGKLILIGYTWALFHHMLGGLRHFVWDLGKGYGPERYTMAWATIGGSIILTGIVWLFLI
jgi:succinate dehydrogenase / fumarate reductase cytochrome b subunit